MNLEEEVAIYCHYESVPVILSCLKIEQSRKVGLPKVSESGLVAGAKRNPRSLAAKSLTKEDHGKEA